MSVPLLGTEHIVLNCCVLKTFLFNVFVQTQTSEHLSASPLKVMSTTAALLSQWK